MVNLAAGATSGISAILIPQLKHSKGEHEFTTDMESWVGMYFERILLVLCVKYAFSISYIMFNDMVEFTN